MFLLLTGCAAMAAEPSTKLDTFKAQTGAILVSSFLELGDVSSPMYSSSAKLTGVWLTHVATGEVSAGVRFDVTESNVRDHGSYVDLEELPDMIAALQYVSTFSPTLLPFPGWQISYQTKGDLQLTVFNSKANPAGIVERILAIQSGDIVSATAYFQARAVASLRDTLGVARERLTEAVERAKSAK